MSYAISAALQAAVYQQLRADVALDALVGDAVYDAVPEGPLPQTYVSLGPEDVRDQSDMGAVGAVHLISVSVVTSAAGFASAKAAAAAVSDALVGADLVLTRGRLVSLGFVKAAARRVGTGAQRRIDLQFRARVEDN